MFQRDKEEVEILSHLTGRILPRKLTLLLGPPSSGKTVFLKALAGRLRPLGGAKYHGEVSYEGDNIDACNFITGKVSDYIEEEDRHSAVLSVEETFTFSWYCTTGGYHSYGRAKDNQSATVLERDDANKVAIRNVLTLLGLNGCKDTYVGDQMTRGVSGGEKRRVTIGEMLVIPRPIKMMDSITTGLDTATAVDIIQALATLNHGMGYTNVISLLQPPPEVFDIFDEIILLYEGHIIFQGAKEIILPYFATLGYHRPPDMDTADFLLELCTESGSRFASDSPLIPHSAAALGIAWKTSKEFKLMIEEMEATSPPSSPRRKQWYPDQQERYPPAQHFWFHLQLNFNRQVKILSRDVIFLKARMGQVFIIGAITGSLFSNIDTTDITTMNGCLYFSLLFSALGAIALVPILYDQKGVFYKMKDALFFPTWTFSLSQMLSLLPLQVLESTLFSSILYWSAGLSEDYYGGRFFTFILLLLLFATVVAQWFRVLSSRIASPNSCLPVAGVSLVTMVLFSGYIQPPNLISDGWIWFYYINPLAWALKAITINEFGSSKYDFLTCVNAPSCTETDRYGDVVLDQYGIPIDQNYIWYSVAVLIGEFIFLLVVNTLLLEYVRSEVAPPYPHRRSNIDQETLDENRMREIWAALENNGVPATDEMIKSESKGNLKDEQEDGDEVEDKLAITRGKLVYSYQTLDNAPPDNKTSSKTNRPVEQLPFDVVTFSFSDIWYTVTLESGETRDLLKGVSGYCEPGKMTALMGSSGAGKTTLLDVLAGRKNSGTVKGAMFLNGYPKVEGYFRQIMGYVEQFDTLPMKSTAREAIDFSAALRLSASITREQREQWVNSVLSMLDLEMIENDLIGVLGAGGMSFEQRKRVSIGVELAANPSILFLDEPTTGLDSLAALSLMQNIRQHIAASGRSIVCTIHQPSALIFQTFDALLLLQKGGEMVYFGSLGEGGRDLIDYFEAIPGIEKMPHNENPATWMLEVIGAGTSSTSSSSENDSRNFHEYYEQTELCRENLEQVQTLSKPTEGSKRLTEAEIRHLETFRYHASGITQAIRLFTRIALTYWRTPSYSLLRIMTNLIIALIFASAYPQQSYDTAVATVSRSAVIFITALFCGVLALVLVIPVLSAERPVFYREQQSRMYSVWIYTMTLVMIEIPYLIMTSLSFTLPFFYIIGFNNVGNASEKFAWYWLFSFLLQATMLFMSEFIVALTPNQQTAQVFAGMMNMINSLFCGFMITESRFPRFWLFMYYLSPLHYALEGLIMTQFQGDSTIITTFNGQEMTAEDYISEEQFSSWSIDNVGYDVMALCLFIAAAIVGLYLSLAYIRHDKR